jgi:UDP-N-acetylglucosamine 2-epimerase (non-hydrolysing)
MVKPRAKILCVVGARPNFMKIAPIMRAFAQRSSSFVTKLVHTGQHYDVAMNERFFQQLRIPAPDISLEIGSASHAVQTAEIMKRFEPVLDAERPDAILVVGDVNSTIACALVAAKKGIKVIHVEAGLRSRDRTMPEEINRILTDQLSDRLYVTEAEAIGNLSAEGIAKSKVVFAGNVMIDTLLASLPEAVPAETTLQQAFARNGGEKIRRAFQSARQYGVLTLHRPSNVDEPAVLARLLTLVAEISATIPIVFPMHPRTSNQIAASGLGAHLDRPGIAVLPPLGYLEMLGLLRQARVVLTDSGGLQEETTALGIPCLTLRHNTERPITVEQGTNHLVGTDSQAIRDGLSAALQRTPGDSKRPEKWDGHAAERIVDDLVQWLGVAHLEVSA